MHSTTWTPSHKSCLQLHKLQDPQQDVPRCTSPACTISCWMQQHRVEASTASVWADAGATSAATAARSQAPQPGRMGTEGSCLSGPANDAAARLCTAPPKATAGYCCCGCCRPACLGGPSPVTRQREALLFLLLHYTLQPSWPLHTTHTYHHPAPHCAGRPTVLLPEAPPADVRATPVGNQS